MDIRESPEIIKMRMELQEVAEKKLRIKKVKGRGSRPKIYDELI